MPVICINAARTIGVATEHMPLKREATTDILTGLATMAASQLTVLKAGSMNLLTPAYYQMHPDFPRVTLGVDINEDGESGLISIMPDELKQSLEANNVSHRIDSMSQLSVVDRQQTYLHVQQQSRFSYIGLAIISMDHSSLDRLSSLLPGDPIA